MTKCVIKTFSDRRRIIFPIRDIIWCPLCTTGNVPSPILHSPSSGRIRGLAAASLPKMREITADLHASFRNSWGDGDDSYGHFFGCKVDNKRCIVWEKYVHNDSKTFWYQFELMNGTNISLKSHTCFAEQLGLWRIGDGRFPMVHSGHQMMSRMGKIMRWRFDYTPCH